jgi:catechol 2,3-dioxygenase-like lactoylglutathione lyase family enzyme
LYCHSGAHQWPNLPGPLNLETTLFYRAFLVTPEKFDRAVKLFEEKGIESFDCTGNGHTTFPGRRHIYIMDPDGNSVELATTIDGE